MKIRTTIVLGAVFIVVLGAQSCRNKAYEGQGETQRIEASLTEQQQLRLIKSTPPPKLNFSLERENLKGRLTRFNDPNKVSYIYLVSFGKVMGFYPMKGKVSSVNSKLTTGEQVVDDPFGLRESGGRVVESPQLDGSYGTNGNAIFFFTTEGVYVEWSGDYMLVDQPLQMATPPQLVYQVSAE